MNNIPKRYFWVAAGAVATFGAIFVKDQFDKRTNAARTKERERSRAERDEKSSARTSAKAESAPVEDELPVGERGAARELALFLVGESWHDESGWRGIWEREGVAEPRAWLKEIGATVLKERRAQLAAHPALLAGCRRRWIVVCRYGKVDVSDAAEMWNQTDG